MNIDQNTRQVGFGIIPGTHKTQLLSGDPTAMQGISLLIEIIPVTSIGLNNVDTRIHIDDNTRQGAAGVSVEDPTTIIPLSCDLIQGLPVLRIEVT